MTELQNLITGILAGAAPLAAWIGKESLSRTRRYDTLRETILNEAREECADLRLAVKLCADRDRRFEVVTQALHLLLPELILLDPDNRGIKLAVRMLKSVPPPSNDDEFSALIGRIDAADAAAATRKAAGDGRIASC